MNAPFWVRRKYFDSYGNRPSEFEADLPPRGVRFTCPCCGYPTLGGRGSYEICELCRWEDEGQDDSNAEEVRGGPNHGYSLETARLNFEEYLVMYPPDQDPRIGGPDSDCVRAIKRQLIVAFDAMMANPGPAELNLLWKTVRETERALGAELKRQLREHSYSSK